MPENDRWKIKSWKTRRYSSLFRISLIYLRQFGMRKSPLYDIYTISPFIQILQLTSFAKKWSYISWKAANMEKTTCGLLQHAKSFYPLIWCHNITMPCNKLTATALHGDTKRSITFTIVTRHVTVVNVVFMFMSPCNLLVISILAALWHCDIKCRREINVIRLI